MLSGLLFSRAIPTRRSMTSRGYVGVVEAFIIFFIFIAFTLNSLSDVYARLSDQVSALNLRPIPIISRDELYDRVRPTWPINFSAFLFTTARFAGGNCQPINRGRVNDFSNKAEIGTVRYVLWQSGISLYLWMRDKKHSRPETPPPTALQFVFTRAMSKWRGTFFSLWWSQALYEVIPSNLWADDLCWCPPCDQFPAQILSRLWKQQHKSSSGRSVCYFYIINVADLTNLSNSTPFCY